jgi:hypothetical protein
MKVIFLDFDNVLNDNAWIHATEQKHPGVVTWSLDIGRELLDPVRVARVQRVCDATGASVVIVSGWRRWAKLEDITMLLREKGLTAPVLGAVLSRFSGDCRADMTRQWLKEHKEVTRYVILDDSQELWFYSPQWKPFHVMPKDGMEDEHVDQAIAILNKE